MNITKSQLKKIINEELQAILGEQGYGRHAEDMTAGELQKIVDRLRVGAWREEEWAEIWRLEDLIRAKRGSSGGGSGIAYNPYDY